MATNYLFHAKGKLSDFLEKQKEEIREVILNLPQNQIEKADPDEISQMIVKQFSLSAPSLQKDQFKKIIEKDIQIKTQEKVPYQTGKLAVGPRVKTVFIDAKEVIVDIPFSGDKELFYYQPAKSILTIPKGEIVGDRLRIKLVFKKEEGVPFDLRLKHQLERIEFYLKGVFEEVDAYNRELPDFVDELIRKEVINKEVNGKRGKISKTRKS